MRGRRRHPPVRGRGGSRVETIVVTVPAQLSRPNLSVREIEVLQLVADGLGNREIAERLYLSEETVKTHVRHVLHKFETGSRAGAVAIGIRRGIIL